MLPKEWVRMGGETCFETGSCADCAASEFALVKKIGQERADEVFREHWETWFSDSDVRDIVDAGLNTVRIPVSACWIVPSEARGMHAVCGRSEPSLTIPRFTAHFRLSHEYNRASLTDIRLATGSSNPSWIAPPSSTCVPDSLAPRLTNQSTNAAARRVKAAGTLFVRMSGLPIPAIAQKRGVQQLKSAGINVLLDFHAMPGVSSSNQMFAGDDSNFHPFAPFYFSRIGSILRPRE